MVLQQRPFLVRNPYKGHAGELGSMEITRWHFVVGVLIGLFIVAIFAFVVPTYYRTYEFNGVTPLGDSSGTWVFHLTDGKNLTLSNTNTADDALGNLTLLEMVTPQNPAHIKVGYTFIGNPVWAGYLP